MEIINATTVAVENQAEFSQVLQGNQYDYVYIMNDIQMSGSGISINNARTSLTIDGLWPLEEPRVIHELSDAGGDLGGIYLTASGQMTSITLQNLIINGRNFYGIPYIWNANYNENVLLTYINVRYIGPQLTWHIRGRVRYIDCEIDTQYTGHSPAQEVAEAHQVEIGGHTIIRHSHINSSPFYLYGSEPSITILENAEVTLTSERDLFYRNSSAVQFTIQRNASFTLSTKRGIGYDSGHRVTNFLIDNNAQFIYSRNATTGSAGALYVIGDFTVNQGARVFMYQNINNNQQLIRFTSSSGGLYLNEPKSFVLYNSATQTDSAVLRFEQQVNYIFTTSQINYWRTATAFEDAGKLADVPLHKWHKLDWGSFLVRGKAAQSGATPTTIEETTLTSDDLEPLDPLTDMRLNEARVLSLGYLPLKISPVYVGSVVVNGLTDGNAHITVQYNATPFRREAEADAMDSGLFEVELEYEAQLSTQVVTTSNVPFLTTQIMTMVTEEPEFGFVEVPEIIEFSRHPIVSGGHLLPRLLPGEEVIVKDTRVEPTQWEIWVRITAPLQTSEGDVLPNALVFGMPDGSYVTLSQTAVYVYTDGPPYDDEEGLTNISWANDKGILAFIDEPVRSGLAYTTSIEWELRETTDDPGGDG